MSGNSSGRASVVESAPAIMPMTPTTANHAPISSAPASKARPVGLIHGSPPNVPAPTWRSSSIRPAAGLLDHLVELDAEAVALPAEDVEHAGADLGPHLDRRPGRNEDDELAGGDARLEEALVARELQPPQVDHEAPGRQALLGRDGGDGLRHDRAVGEPAFERHVDDGDGCEAEQEQETRRDQGAGAAAEPGAGGDHGADRRQPAADHDGRRDLVGQRRRRR